MSKSKNDIASKRELLRYLRGDMSDQEAHRFEKGALDDPFLTDALEGYDHMHTEEIEEDIRSLEEQIARGQKPVYFWYAAAVVLLLLASTLTWNYVSNKSPDNLSQQYESPARDSTQRQETDSPQITDRDMEKPAPIVEKEEVSEDSKSREPTTSQPKQERIVEESEDKVQTIQPIAAPAPKQEPDLASDTRIAEDIAIETIPEESLEQPVEADQLLRAKKREEAMGLRSAVQPSAVAGAVADVMEESEISKKIAGRVISEDGDPLPGVNVIIKNSSRGTITDIDGNFDLDLGPDDSALVASFIGMNTSEALVVESTDSLIIILQEDVSSLSEVVVVGYGVQEVQADQSPGPIGGMSEFRSFVEANLVKPDDQQGKVVLKVSLDESGSIIDIEEKRTLSEAHTSEAIRLIKEYRGFQPAIREGQAYPSSLRVRVKFE